MAAGFGLASMVGLFATMACSDDGGTGSTTTGGAANGGSTSMGGTSSGGTSPGGTSPGGTSPGGTSAGGTGGSGPMTAYPCAGKVPPSDAITDFSMVPEFGDTAEFGGGHYVYPTTSLTPDTAAGDLNVAGMVTNYSGFGLYFANCTDASSFSGIQFDISGNVGTTGMLQVLVQTNEDYQIRSAEMKGACMWTPATEFSACVSPSKMISVSDSVATVMVPWTDLAGGAPTATVSPNQVLGLQFAFAWSGTATAYAVDVTVDNVKFIGGNGSGGTGGTGGTGGGGEGGAP